MVTQNSCDFGTGTLGQLLTSNGTGVAPTFQTPAFFKQINVQTFTTPGAFTYTPTAGTQYVIVELVGGGGGCGGTASTTNIAVSGAGGAGAYAKFLLTSAQIGVSLSGSVGAAGTAGASGNNAGGNGGNTTLATSSPWTAGGGLGGVGGISSTVATPEGAFGGTVTSGTGTVFITSAGGEAGQGVASSPIGFVVGGYGGSSFYGVGGAQETQIVLNNGASGSPGYGYGSGASAATALGTVGNQTGTAGNAGIAIFTEFV